MQEYMESEEKKGFAKIEFNSYAQMLECSATLFLSAGIADLEPYGEKTLLVPDHYMHDDRVKKAINDARSNEDLNRDFEEIARSHTNDIQITPRNLYP